MVELKGLIKMTEEMEKKNLKEGAEAGGEDIITGPKAKPCTLKRKCIHRRRHIRTHNKQTAVGGDDDVRQVRVRNVRNEQGEKNKPES